MHRSVVILTEGVGEYYPKKILIPIVLPKRISDAKRHYIRQCGSPKYHCSNVGALPNTLNERYQLVTPTPTPQDVNRLLP